MVYDRYYGVKHRVLIFVPAARRHDHLSHLGVLIR
jgi:hypothetical protein